MLYYFYLLTLPPKTSNGTFTHMKHLSIAVVTLLLILGSCASDEPITPDKRTVQESAQAFNPHKVPLSHALGYAEQALNLIEGHTATRSGRTVESVEYVSNHRTRSADSRSVIDTALYLVNYANDKGFAILAADNRLHPIYAISDEIATLIIT